MIFRCVEVLEVKKTRAVIQRKHASNFVSQIKIVKQTGKFCWSLLRSNMQGNFLGGDFCGQFLWKKIKKCHMKTFIAHVFNEFKLHVQLHGWVCVSVWKWNSIVTAFTDCFLKWLLPGSKKFHWICSHGLEPAGEKDEEFSRFNPACASYADDVVKYLHCNFKTSQSKALRNKTEQTQKSETHDRHTEKRRRRPTWFLLKVAGVVAGAHPKSLWQKVGLQPGPRSQWGDSAYRFSLSLTQERWTVCVDDVPPHQDHLSQGSKQPTV